MSLQSMSAYIGTDDTQIVPALVHAQTLLRSPSSLRIEVFLLQADCGRLLRFDGRDLVDAGPLPMQPHERPTTSGTRFSLARFVIPELRGYQGRAIYFDSDQICLGDPRELWETPLGESCLAASVSRRQGDSPDALDTSVMLMDCARCQWRIHELLDGLRTGRWTYWELMCLSGRAASLRKDGVVTLEPEWNTYDTLGPSTRLLHYTTREQQPWKNDDLPSRESRSLWEAELARALREVPILGNLIQQGVRNGDLKPQLLSIL